MQRLRLKPYIDAEPAWPDRGRVILAQYDGDTVVVYETFNRGLARYAVEHGRLDAPEFNFERMHWVRPGYLWTMRQSGWASEPGQRAALAIWLLRDAFEAMLREAVPSRYPEGVYGTRAEWQRALDESDVHVQWSPDFPPRGPKLGRRVIQLGLRGDTLRRYATQCIAHIEDVTDFAHQQARFVATPEMLFVPAQDIYPVRDQTVAERLGLDKSVPD